MKFRVSLSALAMGALFLSAAVHAEGSAARGKVLAYTCHGCHGIPNYKNVYPTYSVPKVGGQNATYIVNALKGYATGERVHPTMHAQAASLSQQDWEDIAAFFAATPVRKAGEPVGPVPAAAQACAACHGKDGIAVDAQYPILAGQHEDYLERAIKEYKSGIRKNPIMSSMAQTIKDDDIPALAHFFSSQKPALCSTDEIRDYGKCR